MSKWRLDSNRIVRDFDRGETAKDHFAMSGAQVDLILEWRVGRGGGFAAVLRARFPQLRTVPNDTHASFEQLFTPPGFRINGAVDRGRVKSVALSELFTVTIDHDADCREIREIFPSADHDAIIDLRTIENRSRSPVALSMPRRRNIRGGMYQMSVFSDLPRDFELPPGGKVSCVVEYSSSGTPINPMLELAERLNTGLTPDFGKLELETPELEINAMFGFALRHAVESIFDTPNGPVHSPGGYGKYLAAIWANDEAEYANPFFPFTGVARADAAALNSYRWFMKYMNRDFTPLPSSIIAGGTDIWNGAGDRGDAAMIAHGAARFALASGNRDIAAELRPLVEWCLEYCARKLTGDGVVASDCDELERRFPAGTVNLSTNMLYYDALLRTAALRRALNIDDAEELERRAANLRTAAGRIFSADVEGFATYRYYDGNTILRSWICLPLCFGINDRKAGTLAALFSPKLWRGDGLLTASDNETYWDRSTLYALRGVFFCGEPDLALHHLRSYVRARLLGSHVPYPIEAFPEYNASQLSAESALFCRIFTEGMFGIVPTGLNRFTVKPSLPSGWRHAALRGVSAFGKTGWGIELDRKDSGIEVTIPGVCHKFVPENGSIEIIFQ
ncbi:MAG: hypothetical protein PHI85_07865 [Victivallaceae bacterium]|nr:hypothetical protein [Victivallaceae bacterium]